jgi:hypothetical protein
MIFLSTTVYHLRYSICRRLDAAASLALDSYAIVDSAASLALDSCAIDHGTYETWN